MKRIVIDCDPGIDDAQAIMMAHMHPNIKIEAITSVAGNVGVEKTTKNVLKILKVLDADAIPVFSGAASPLAEPSEDASYFHGEDGLGGALLKDSTRAVESESAAAGLIRLGQKYPGELELIALGPLTNLALALKLFPKLPDLYQRLVIMGGAYLAQGNSPNLAAEFNIYANPEAAKKRRNIVLGLMAQHGFITEEEAAKAKDKATGEPILAEIQATLQNVIEQAK